MTRQAMLIPASQLTGEPDYQATHAFIYRANRVVDLTLPMRADWRDDPFWQRLFRAHGRLAGQPTYKFQKNGCIHWQGATNGNNRGIDHGVPAYRRTFEHFRGTIPAGHHCHHECGNALCVRPDHLRLIPAGAHRALGPNEKGLPVSIVKARKMFALRAAGFGVNKIAKFMRCGHSYVSMVLSGKRMGNYTRDLRGLTSTEELQPETPSQTRNDALATQTATAFGMLKPCVDCGRLVSCRATICVLCGNPHPFVRGDA